MATQPTSRMREKLVYRSHFQPAPAKKPSISLPSNVNEFQRSSSPPYRVLPTKRHVTRFGIFLLAFSFSLWLVGRVNDTWFYRRGKPRSMQEWRAGYDADERGLPGLPLEYTLPSGDRIPSVALGVWKARPGEVGLAVKSALEAGYRHIDGAWIYGNEPEVGQTLQTLSSHYPRTSLFITSKLWNTFHAPEDVEPALDETLKHLQTDYLDLYLLHWPIAQNRDKEESVNEDLTEHPIKTWKVLEALVRKGKIRNIGVSNFNIRRLQNLTSSDITIKPAVNQVELSYWNPQPELLKWSKENGILLEAYSPLGGSGMVAKTLRLPVVKEIARELKITPAQVIISWHVQRGTVVLPKSVDPGRISENYQLFTLPDNLFQKLEEAATSHKPIRTVDPSARLGWDVFEDEKED